MPDPILIAGAGPTGLVLALELARRGVPCRLIDQAPAPSPYSRAIALHARTLECLAALGLADAFAARGLRIGGGAFHLGRGRVADLSFAGMPSRFSFVLSLPQNETEALLAAAAASRGVAVERGVALAGLAQDRDGVTARLRRADGTEEECRARWLVGCDGAHSAARHALGLDFAGASYPEPFLLADVAVAGPGSLGADRFHLFPCPEGVVALFPLPGGRSRIIAALPVGAPEGTPTLAECQALLDARLGPLGIPVRLSDPRWTATFRIHRRHVSRLRAGRVFLAGDAAHIHSPAGGQGMNTGIQDAVNLGWKLARAARGAAPALLDTYEAERLPVQAGVLRDTDRLTRLVSLPPGPLRWLRDRLLPGLLARAFVRRRAGLRVSQLAVHYRGGPLAEEHPVPGSGPRAGDRAPDLALAEGWLLPLLATGEPVLLLLLDGEDARAGDLEAAFRVRFGPGAPTARTDLRGAYGHAPAAYLIRPDGYVGFRAPLALAAARLPAYLVNL